jgi:hypothetical protein
MGMGSWISWVLAFNSATETARSNLGYPYLNATGICPAIADFNGDGKLDLAIPYKNGVSVLFGNGDGTFQSPVTSQLGIDMSALGSGSLLAADFNGDGKPDLFVRGSATTIPLNGGSGRFSYAGAASYPFPGDLLGDFNADGRTDVISSVEGQGSQLFARTALAAPNGTLSLPRAYFIRSDDGTTPSLAAGDFNGDGKLDLAAVTADAFWNTGELNVLLARRAGIFLPPFSSSTRDDGTNFVATADLNHDGKLDLVMASGGREFTFGSVNLRLGRGDGTFQKSVNYPAVRPSALLPSPISMLMEFRTWP